jgi:anti-sigma factor RsiW
VTARARGFNVRLWQRDGLGYALVSDLDPSELARLAERLGG